MNGTKIFSTNILVLINHINYGNHLGYDSMLSILQESRLRWLKTINKHSSEINIENNIGWLIKDVNLSYKAEAHHGDELTIDLFISNLKKTNFIFEYTVHKINSKKLLCQGTTKQVFFDFKHSKISRIPDSLATYLHIT